MATKNSLIPLLFSEMIGTALLLFAGLSVVIFFWGTGSAMGHWIPSDSFRRLVTGFLFGCVGCLVTISPVGKISGAHINPAVSLAFWLNGKMKAHAMAGYVISQLLGAVLGSLPLLLWGKMGKSIRFGITLPGPAGPLAAYFGEVITTVGLILVIFVFVSSKKLRNYTPYTMPPLYGLMVWAETVYSGCSTNPARSFGPAMVSQTFNYYWIYWLGPVTGVLLVVGIFRALKMHEKHEMKAARVSYHDSKTPNSLKSS